MTDFSSLPLISVIMPTYNAARFIEEAVRSVLAQTYPNWELLIVDDASTDQTAAILQTITDPRIRYHRVERIGSPAGVRNRGLKLAKGEFIAFLDSDDMYFPDTLERLLRRLLKNPDLCAVYGFAFNMDESGEPLAQTVQLARTPSESAVNDDASFYEVPPQYRHTWFNIVTSRSSCQLPGLMLRRRLLESVGLFNESLSGVEDYEFYLRLYLHDYDGVACLGDYIYRYRIHPASLTKSSEYCQRLLQNCLTIMNWLFDEAPLPFFVQKHRSLAYVGCYRYMARERLLHGQSDLARRILLQAWNNPRIRLKDFLLQCGPLLIRSFLPSFLDRCLVSVKRRYRQLKNDRFANIRSVFFLPMGASS